MNTFRYRKILAFLLHSNSYPIKIMIPHERNLGCHYEDHYEDVSKGEQKLETGQFLASLPENKGE